MDIVIRESLRNLEGVRVHFSMDGDQVPFTLVKMEFKTEEFARGFFERAIPFWVIQVNLRERFCSKAWDHVRINGKSIEFYVIHDKPDKTGTLHGRALSLVNRIEKCLESHHSSIPTNIQPGISPMPNFCFGLEEYTNQHIRAILQRTTGVIAERWFDSNHVAFTKISVEFQIAEAADAFCERAIPFWKPFYDVICKKPNTPQIVEFYTIEEAPHNANMHGRALRLLRQIEKHSSVTTQVFPGLRQHASN